MTAPAGPCISAWLVFLLLAVCAPAAPAHEVPANVRVELKLAAAGSELEVLLRVPLEAMRDFEFARRGVGYVDLERIEPQLEQAAALWLVPNLKVFAAGAELPAPALSAVRLALPGDRSFETFERARRAIAEERLPVDTDIFWEQALLDVALRYQLPAGAAPAAVELEPTFARLGGRTVTEVAFVDDDGEPRQLVFVGDPGRISLQPGLGQVFGSFLFEGFRHVLGGMDHLLFLAALVAPVRRLRPLVIILTAFTLAHSLTLGASVLGLAPQALWFPSLVETLIAASILYMALENILRSTVQRRWLLAYGFGLVHGFGFSFALGETLMLAGDHLWVSLLAFNLGIEAGQLLVIVLAVPLWRALLERLPARTLVVVASAFIAHSGWHWLTDRGEVLLSYAFSWPAFDVAFRALLARWLMLLLTAALVCLLVQGLFRRWEALPRERSSHG